MHKNRNKIALIAMGVAILLLLLFLGFRGRSYTWFEHYRPDSKDPYGTFVVHELLKEYFPGDNFELLRDSIPSADSLGNYIFIGRDFWMDSLKQERLLRFVEAGSDAFIAANYIPEELLDTLTNHECTDLTYTRDSVYFEPLDYFIQDSSVSLNLVHGELKKETDYDCTFLIQNEPVDYYWQYFPNELFCESRTNLTSLGNINGLEVNFIKIKYGKGKVYLHHNPIAFTNIHMLEKSGLKYVERTLSHLEARPIYWDRMSRRMGDFDGGRGGQAGNLFADSPLRYILSQPALKWAWYTLLGMALLYLIFKAKRRQRIIPVLEKNENTSLEFISTIGRLHFIENNHLALSKQKMKLFLGYIRERYHLPTKELNEQFEKELIARSEVSEEVVRKIFTIHRNMESSRFASENVLVNLHREMAKFYQTCK